MTAFIPRLMDPSRIFRQRETDRHVDAGAVGPKSLERGGGRTPSVTAQAGPAMMSVRFRRGLNARPQLILRLISELRSGPRSAETESPSVFSGRGTRALLPRRVISSKPARVMMAAWADRPSPLPSRCPQTMRATILTAPPISRPNHIIGQKAGKWVPRKALDGKAAPDRSSAQASVTAVGKPRGDVSGEGLGFLTGPPESRPA